MNSSDRLHAVQTGERVAVMLTGGGARAAYQAGLLRGIARRFPHLQFRIVTGVSAGAINAIFLAARKGSLSEKAHQLAELWSNLQFENIYQFDWRTILPSRISSPLRRLRHMPKGGLVDTRPLGELLARTYDCRPGEPIQGIIENIREGHLDAVALITLDYSTGQNVRWVQGGSIDHFEGPNRRSAQTEMTLEHVLASAALPFIFPAVQLGNQWFGDGGIRLAAPLSPAVHLGATRIVAMSTAYQRTWDEATTPVVHGYPPAAQILGQLLNAIFLDVIEEDVVRMERMNRMLRKLPPAEREGFKPIELLVLRPSIDLSKAAREYEKYLPRDLRLLTRALGSRETESPDLVSMLMFEPHYMQRLIEIAEEDVQSRIEEISAFLGQPVQLPRAI